jgi:hypothetical protein
MNPLEMLRETMDEDYFAFTEKLIENGAHWKFSNFSNEAALYSAEDDLLVVLDRDNNDFECTVLFDDLYFAA